MKNKKAELSVIVLIGIVLTLVVGVILLLFAVQLKKAAESGEERAGCRIALVAASSVERGSFGIVQVKKKCPQRPITIKSKEAFFGGQLDEQALFRRLGTEAYLCWDMTGRGRIDPFADFMNAAETYCLVCSTITFDESLKKALESRGNTNLLSASSYGMSYYLAKTEIQNENSTLYELFTGEPVTSSQLITLEQDKSPLDVRVPYSVVFYVDKYYSGMSHETWAGLAGGAWLAFTKKPKSTQTEAFVYAKPTPLKDMMGQTGIMVVPQSDVPELCTKIVN